MIEGSLSPFATGVSIIGRKKSDGTIIPKEDTKIPYELHYVRADPNFNAENTVDPLKWYTNLKEIPADTDLFEVWGWSAHKDCEDAEYHKIAIIRLQTKLYTSVAGDERMYFQHRRV